MSPTTGLVLLGILFLIFCIALARLIQILFHPKFYDGIERARMVEQLKIIVVPLICINGCFLLQGCVLGLYNSCCFFLCSSGLEGFSAHYWEYNAICWGWGILLTLFVTIPSILYWIYYPLTNAQNLYNLDCLVVYLQKNNKPVPQELSDKYKRLLNTVLQEQADSNSASSSKP